jgi:hypothetical protein
VKRYVFPLLMVYLDVLINDHEHVICPIAISFFSIKYVV